MTRERTRERRDDFSYRFFKTHNSLYGKYCFTCSQWHRPTTHSLTHSQVCGVTIHESMPSEHRSRCTSSMVFSHKHRLTGSHARVSFSLPDSRFPFSLRHFSCPSLHFFVLLWRAYSWLWWGGRSKRWRRHPDNISCHLNASLWGLRADC